MNIRILAGLLMLGLFFRSNVIAQDKEDTFCPVVLWGNNVTSGVVLIKPNEMLIIDSAGNKQGKVLADEAVDSAYVSPDGKKLIYTTMTGVWLVKIRSGEKYLVLKGYCDYLRWNADSSSLIFSLGTRVKGEISNVKVFWADGDGKNLKQVYP